MYRRFYKDASDLAETIRQGKAEKPSTKATPLKGLGARAHTQVGSSLAQGAEEENYKELTAKKLATMRQENEEFRSYLENAGLEGPADTPKSSNRKAPKTDLLNDVSFVSKLNEMAAKYPGFSSDEALYMFHKESGYNTRAQNKNSKAAGIFQATPSTAKGLGTTVDEILEMSATEQLELYDKYLTKNGYDGSQSLGLLNAAPGYASRSPDTIVYKKGSKAWQQNPGWRDSNGNITVSSINRFYRGN